MQSKAKTVPAYLATLPADRRAAIETVRDVVNRNLDPGIDEGMMYGMICWYVPFSAYPAGYHVTPDIPLPFAALASQKNHMALYLMHLYPDDGGEARFLREWAKSGKKLDRGKSCLRFKRLDDVALDVVADAIRGTPMRTYIAEYEKHLPTGAKTAKRKTAAGAKAAGKPASKRAAKPATRKVAAKKK